MLPFCFPLERRLSSSGSVLCRAARSDLALRYAFTRIIPSPTLCKWENCAALTSRPAGFFCPLNCSHSHLHKSLHLRHGVSPHSLTLSHFPPVRELQSSAKEAPLETPRAVQVAKRLERSKNVSGVIRNVKLRSFLFEIS